MSYRTGIIAAQDGKTINDTPQAYRSDYGHLSIDTREETKHIGIYDGKCGTQVLVNNNSTSEEIFKTIDHNLPFIPKVSAYMLIRDAPAALATIIGWYAGGRIFYGGFPMSESIFVRVDKKSIHFVHQSGTAGTTNYNSILQDMVIRAKYMIFSNEAVDEPYEIIFPSL